MTPHQFRPPRAATLLVLLVALSVATGCKSAGEKKYEEAKALQRRGMTTEAITAYEESARLLDAEGKQPGRAYDKLGGIYKASREFDKSEDMYLRAIADDPTKFDRHAKLMSVYRQTERWDDAIKVYEAIRTHPDLRFELRDRENLENAYKELIAAREQAERDAARAAAEAAEEGDGSGAAPEADANGTAPAADPPADSATEDAPTEAPSADATPGD